MTSKQTQSDKQAQSEPTRVFIVEDHPLVRSALKQLLEQDVGLMPCGEAETVDQAKAMIEEHQPHVVLVDLALPGVNGMELIKHIKKHWLGMKVIVVSTYDETVYGPLAMECGADCYINKHEAMDEIVKAIHAVMLPGPDQNNYGRKISHWFG